MYSYHNIIVALDLFFDHKPILDRALDIAQSSSQISLIYVTSPQIYLESYGLGIGTDFVNDNQETAKATLLELAKTYHIPDEQVYAPIGSAVDEIHLLSESVKADLIVLGTHGHSGLKLLLGSTANGVLHGVKCDVLAIKI